MFQTVSTLEELHHLKTKDATLIYYSHQECSVCKVLKPKVAELFQSTFPKVELFYCDIQLAPEVAGQESVFAVPTLVIAFGGQEFYRIARNVSLAELEEKVKRPYEMMFGDA